MKKLLTLPFLFIFIYCNATNYYVKSGGSDVANGLSDGTAWATVAKVNSSMGIFKPGDAILFRRGDTWTSSTINIGIAGILGNNITIGAYGTGSKPIISGSTNNPAIKVTAANRGYWTINELDLRSSGFPSGIYNSLAIYFAYWQTDLGPVPGWIIQNCSFNSCILVSGPGTLIKGNVFYGAGNSYNRGGAIALRGPNAKDVIVENNTISNYIDRGIWVYNGAPSATIRNNTIHDIVAGSDNAGMGVNIDGYGVPVPNAKIYGNYIYNCDGIGASCENGFNAEYYNNLVVNCKWGGFDIYWYAAVYGQASNVKIHHNIVRNGEYGVMINAANTATIAHNTFIKDNASLKNEGAFFVTSSSTYVSNITFANNIITGTWAHQVKVPDSKNIWARFDYNNIVPKGTEIMYRGGTSLSLAQVQALGFMTHGTSSDPRFINPASDWHLQSGSPAINSGMNLNFTSDYDGKIIDATPDMGAYEYTGTTTPVNPLYVSSVIQNTATSVVEITYNTTLANIVPSASSFLVLVNSVARTVNSVSISGTKVLLTLSSSVAYGNAVTIAYTKPSTNPLQSTSGGQAATITAKAVTNNISALIPTYVSSAIQNTAPSILEMTYNTTLANIVPSALSFSVLVNSVARTVNSVSISGTKVLLTLASSVAYGNTVTVAYTKPSTNPLQTTAGGQAATITAKTVINNISGVALPLYISSVVRNTTASIIEMTYNSNLANVVPPSSAFSVKVNSVAMTVNSVSISGTKVLLTISSSVAYGNAVTVAYTKPSTNPLRNTNGGQAVSFGPQTVTNWVNAIPQYISSAVQNLSPSVLELSYNFPLAKIVPATSAFVVRVNSVIRTVSKVAISGTKVLLTLSSRVNYGNTVTVAYTKPSINPIQISSGGQAISIGAMTVTNKVLASASAYSAGSITSPSSIDSLSYDAPESKMQEDKIRIFPNPVKDFINITGEETSYKSRILRIYDYSGRLCMESRLDLSSSNAAIPINLKSGFYILKIFSGQVILHTEKILVR